MKGYWLITISIFIAAIMIATSIIYGPKEYVFPTRNAGFIKYDRWTGKFTQCWAEEDPRARTKDQRRYLAAFCYSDTPEYRDSSEFYNDDEIMKTR